jgi:hypothetical protein
MESYLVHLSYYIWNSPVLNDISSAIGVYSIFIYDFGEREHVFQPVSRSSGLSFFFEILTITVEGQAMGCQHNKQNVYSFCCGREIAS